MWEVGILYWLMGLIEQVPRLRSAHSSFDFKSSKSDFANAASRVFSIIVLESSGIAFVLIGAKVLMLSAVCALL